MSYPSKLRVTLNILLVASVLFAPPWAVAIVAVFFAARYRAWEVVIAGMCMDLLWLPHSLDLSVSLDNIPAATLLSILLVFGLEPLRRQLLLGSAIL